MKFKVYIANKNQVVPLFWISRSPFWDAALHTATAHYTIVAAATAAAVRIVGVVTRLLKLVTKLFFKFSNRTETNAQTPRHHLYHRK